MKSFRYAFNGIKFALQTEQHMKVHLLCACIVILVGAYFNITRFEWLILLLTIALVMTLEMINTALEKVVDLVTEEFHPLAMHAKDVAAGAVLIASVFAVVIGCIIFIPYL